MYNVVKNKQILSSFVMKIAEVGTIAEYNLSFSVVLSIMRNNKMLIYAACGLVGHFY